MSRQKPSMLMLRWLALGAAAGSAVTLGLSTYGLAGPWQSVALVLALLTVFALLGVIVSMRRRDHELEDADVRARRDEAELGALQAELDRHTQLEGQLRHAKQAAEAAVMAKGEFLATMSHEIRTPLNGIVPMLDLLMNARLNADHAELVRTAYTSSQQMLRIVDDILDYSKLEADKLELESTGFNLRELLDGVIQLMERPAQSKGLRLSLQLDASVRLPVRGDPVRLRQVLGNLISNAVKFTERGAVSVSVRRIGETPAQHQLRFEVRDSGIGISAEAQTRLFQAFSQADTSTTRLYGGTGLGLAISKRIVDLMGGRIGVDSERGAGATFWFEIPLLKVQGDIAQRDPGVETGGRLLLLTADPRLRLRLSMLLPNWGLRVSSVETTQEALDRLRTAANQGAPWAYSLVLADLAGMRNTAVALHRNLSRQSLYGDVRLVCLYGDDPIPDELRRTTSLLSRQAPDEDLRAALTSPMSAKTPDILQREAAALSTVELPDAATTRAARVLLVEDNPVNLMVGQRLLSVLGISCDTASNGEAALMRMSASRYDVVLMDCQMPVMDGYTATQRWREGEDAAGDGRHLPIVAMTANAMAGDRQKCLDAGMDDYLPKPVTRSELERCLHRWWNPEVAAIRSQEPVPGDEVAAVPHVPAGSAAEAPTADAPTAIEPTHASAPAHAAPALNPPLPPLSPAPQGSPAWPAPSIATDDGAVHRAAEQAPVTHDPLKDAAAPWPGPAASKPPAPAAPTPTPQWAVPLPPASTAGTPPHSADAAPQPARPQPAHPTPPPAAAVPSWVVAPVASSGHSPMTATTPPASLPPADSTPARPGQPVVIDHDTLEELRSMLGNEVDRLIDVFLEDTPRLIGALENAAIGPDYVALRDAAHSLKSSSANLGALSLSSAAKRIELGAREQSLERPAVAVALVANEFLRARQVLLAAQRTKA